MPGDEIPSDYRVVQLIQRDPPDDVLRQAEMIPGEAGRYARVIRYRHDFRERSMKSCSSRPVVRRRAKKSWPICAATWHASRRN